MPHLVSGAPTGAITLEGGGVRNASYSSTADILSSVQYFRISGLFVVFPTLLNSWLDTLDVKTSLCPKSGFNCWAISFQSGRQRTSDVLQLLYCYLLLDLVAQSEELVYAFHASRSARDRSLLLYTNYSVVVVAAAVVIIFVVAVVVAAPVAAVVFDVAPTSSCLSSLIVVLVVVVIVDVVFGGYCRKVET